MRYQREQPGELIHIDIEEARADRGDRPSDTGARRSGPPTAAALGEPAARRDTRRGAGWEAVHVCIDDASRLGLQRGVAG